MDYFGFDPANYSISINIFVRLLGVIYCCAYFPFLFEVKGLLGFEGIRPIDEFLKRVQLNYGKKSYFIIPTLFWFNASDKALMCLVWTGFILGILLAFGVFPSLILLILILIHISLTNAGQDFLSFGWETFLIEISIATMIMTATYPYNVFGWLSLNFLLFRFYIQAGMSKITSRDPNWRNFKAIAFHYLTQPIPNLTAWYFYYLPMWFHKFSVGVMFFVELIVPLFMFSPPWVRLICFILMFGLQWSIWLTGNLSYLNHMTAFVCVVLIHNQFLQPFFSFSTPQLTPMVWNIIVSIAGLAFFILQVICLLNTFFRNQIFTRILVSVQPFHLAQPHGIFAVMTTKRYEIVVEGSEDGVNWMEYEFFHKPGNIKERPRRVSPYQPRLDWQAWFLPFGRYITQYWFQAFLLKLLLGSKPVLKLLKVNPFPDHPPLYIRALMYDYTYTTPEEKKKTGNWWNRKLIGIYANPMKLQNKN